MVASRNTDSAAKPLALAATNLRSTWPEGGPDVFLGAWCFDRREDAENFPDAVVAPYPWRDLELRTKGLQDCLDISLRIARNLGPFFSDLAEDALDERDMDLLVAGVIGRIVMGAYHDFVCLREAASRYENLQLVGLRREDYAVPATMNALLEHLRQDDVHLQLISDLAPPLGISVDLRSRRDLVIPPVMTAVEKLRRLQRERRGIGRKMLSAATKTISRRQAFSARCVLYNGCFSRRESVSLALKSAFRIATLPLVDLEQASWSRPSAKLRSRLEAALTPILGSDPFQMALRNILPAMMPVSILEGFPLLKSIVAEKFPQAPKTIASGMAWNNDDAFRLWCLQSRKRGSRLVSCQHGGAYGKRYRPGVAEHMEYLVVDRFASWGGSGQQARSRITLPIPPSQLTERGQAPGEGILYVGTSVERWTFSIAHYPMGSMFYDYLDRQIAFCKALPSKLHPELLLRANPADVGWSETKQLRRYLPEVKIDDFSRPFLERLRSSRLAVVDNLNTTYLQCLGSGIPTILVWDPDVWTVNKLAAQHFARLEAAGVYYRTPAAAAAAVERVWPEPEKWWSSPDVARPVNEFLDSYLKRDPKWAEPWIRELLRSGNENSSSI